MTGIVFLILRLILAAILFVFMGFAFFTLWRDLRNQDQILTHANIPLLSLQSCANELQPPYQFNEPEVFIGRDLACELVLDDKTISARHARLTYHHTQWWIEDLHSTNGTYLNQEKINGATVLASGDELRCGQLEFVIEIGGRASPKSE